MPSEPFVAMTHPDIPGDELAFATLTAFTVQWEPQGWVIAEIGLQPDINYSIPSTEKGAPFGVATLDENGLVVQAGQGPTGGVTEAEMDAAIAAAIATVTPASIGAHPVTTPVIVYTDSVQSTPMRATHPIANGLRQDYVLTDGTCWVMAPLGQKTQLAPGYTTPSVELALEKTIDTISLSTVLSTTLDPNSVYDLIISFIYESTVAASGERLRLAFDPPPGTTGFWGVTGLAVTQAAANGSASYLPKKYVTETFDIGGSGAGVPRWAQIRGTVFTGDHEPAPDAEANFDFRARLSTLDGVGVPLVPAKIYGANTADWDAARMTLTKLAG